MKKTVWLLVAVLALVCSVQLYAFTGKDDITENRSVTGFERIRLQGSPDIKYTQGNTWSVRVKAPKSVLKDVETRVEKNCLVVGLKGNRWFNLKDNDVTVYVTSPDLIGVEVQGSGDFESLNKVDTDNLDLSVRGSGDIKFSDIICDRIKSAVVGSGDIEIKMVTAQQSEIGLVGSGDVKIRQSRVNKTQIELKGSGDVKVHFDHCREVNCRLVGSGDITLTGSVTKLNRSSVGSGDIRTDGLQLAGKSVK